MAATRSGLNGHSAAIEDGIIGDENRQSERERVAGVDQRLVIPVSMHDPRMGKPTQKHTRSSLASGARPFKSSRRAAQRMKTNPLARKGLPFLFPTPVARSRAAYADPHRLLR